MSLTPALFTSGFSDTSNPLQFQPSHWNRVVGLIESLLGTTGATGGLLVRDSVSANGASWVAPVATGSVLTSAGATSAPAWTATPSLTSLTLSTPLAAGSGGTGANLAPFVVGDVPYAVSTSALAKLAAVAVGSVLVSGGAGAAPAWSATPSLTSVTFSGGSVLDGATANVLQQRNGTNPQSLLIYSTFTNSSNYERGGIDFTTLNPRLTLGTAAAGTGTARDIDIRSGGVNVFVRGSGGGWQIANGGHWIALADNASDIGQTNSQRPRHGHFAGYLAIGDGISAPGAGAGEARIYVDTADGDLKVVFSDGTIKTIVVDT